MRGRALRRVVQLCGRGGPRGTGATKDKRAFVQGRESRRGVRLQGLLKSALVVGNSKAKKKLGYTWKREGSWLFSQRVVPDASSLHVTDQ